MTIDQIRYFLALAERLNFRAVAEKFFITQPTLSRQIANLEEEVGCKLFLRNNPNVELTPAGKAMYEGMSEVYIRYDRALREMREVDAASNGQLAIAIEEDQLILPVLREAIMCFQKRMPNIHLAMLRAPLRAIREGLTDHSLDLGVLMRLDGAYLRDLASIQLSEEPSCLAVNRELRRQYPDTITPSQADEIARRIPLHMTAPDHFIAPADPTGLLRENTHMTLQTEEVRCDGDPRSTPLHVSTGHWSAVVNASHILAIDPDVAMFPIQDAAPFQKLAVYDDKSDNPALLRFLEILQERMDGG